MAVTVPLVNEEEPNVAPRSSSMLLYFLLAMMSCVRPLMTPPTMTRSRPRSVAS